MATAQISEKTLEFSMMLPALSAYTNIITVIDTLTLFADEYCEEDRGMMRQVQYFDFL